MYILSSQRQIKEMGKEYGRKEISETSYGIFKWPFQVISMYSVTVVLNNCGVK
jgi:hypothetical protein